MTTALRGKDYTLYYLTEVVEKLSLNVHIQKALHLGLTVLREGKNREETLDMKTETL